MLKRLEYLIKHLPSYRQLLSLTEDYRLVTEAFERLRFQAIKYNQLYLGNMLTLGIQNAQTDKITAVIVETAERERSILQDVLELVSKQI